MLINKTIITLAVAGTVAAGTAIYTGVSMLRDRFGYGPDGFNANGFDKEGYDREGYNKSGYNREGYDKDGLDKKGYDCDGYNKAGRDKSGFTREGYAQRISVMENYCLTARAKADAGDTDGAFLAVRKGLEQGVRCVVAHKLKESYSKETLYTNLEVCKTYGLLEEDFIARLHRARMNCNEAIHGDRNRKSALYNAISVLEELLTAVKEMTGNL